MFSYPSIRSSQFLSVPSIIITYVLGVDKQLLRIQFCDKQIKIKLNFHRHQYDQLCATLSSAETCWSHAQEYNQGDPSFIKVTLQLPSVIKKKNHLVH